MILCIILTIIVQYWWVLSLFAGAEKADIDCLSGNVICGIVVIHVNIYTHRLADTIDSEGGLKYMILTHRDNIADHAKWKERFPVLERIIHR